MIHRDVDEYGYEPERVPLRVVEAPTTDGFPVEQALFRGRCASCLVEIRVRAQWSQAVLPPDEMTTSCMEHDAPRRVIIRFQRELIG